eukprot:scaffold2109_cov123-Isochrysis_galbana.AAC.11
MTTYVKGKTGYDKLVVLGSYKSRHSRVSAEVPMTFPIASAARRSAVPIPAPGDRPARHKGPRAPA